MAQESYKFNITIRENIIFSKEKNRDSLILNTMQKLTALSIVGRLENGLDTRIGASLYDDGIDLSGGETQKIVATRTLLDNADIWIFDEPVAAMDPSSEYSFFNTVLEEDDKSKTMIFVSHRLKIASKMNRIIYLENGKRLDSYDPDAREIISRKATDLDKITEETYRGYLSEFSQKYSEGTKIRSNAYPELDGQELKGSIY